MNYPRIYLVLDNCFAIKRWVRPSEWMQIAQDLGFRYVQASTDNEIDPLFCTESSMDDWFREVKRLQKEKGMRVVNFYTGYQTYRTVGLAHYDRSVRMKIKNEWIKSLILRIADLEAKGLGFSFFAIEHEILQEPGRYRQVMEMLRDEMADIAEFAFQNGGVQVSVEQMYAPHQPPFTIRGAKDFIQNTYAVNKKPIYITIDVGHMVGQNKFLKADKRIVADAVRNNSTVWLGSDRAYQLFDEAVQCANENQRRKLIGEIMEDMDEHEYLFSTVKDSNVFKWLEELACFSPIIHMQQTDGRVSNHAAFTPEANGKGIIKGDRVLHAIKQSFDRAAITKRTQEPVDDIFLSFELFFANTDTKKEIITKLGHTIDYWRKFVPEDGIMLDEAVKKLNDPTYI